MIDTKSLRSKVLDLAIQGKLTEQFETDGTAEELYQQIQEEKHKLIKEGKIKKEKALLPIKDDEIPFDIPNNWKWCRLSDIGSTNIGLTYHPCDIKEKGTLVIRSSNIQNGKMDYSDRVFVNCSVKDNQYLQKNDIIICARNGSKALVGKNAIYDGESNKVAFGAFMAVFRTSIYFYTYYYFNTQVFKRYFSNDDSKQINQVTQSILKESVIPLPPLAEQKRIVERVEEIFKLLDIIDEAQKKYSADAEILKSKLITMGIQGKLTKQLDSDGTAEEYISDLLLKKNEIDKSGVLKGRKKKKILPVTKENQLFNIPRNWKWVRLDLVSEVFGRIGFRGYKKTDIVAEHEGAITISPSNILKTGVTNFDTCTYLSWEKYEESPEIQIFNEDILVVKTGSSYGKCAVVRDLPEKATINPQIAVLKYVLCDKEYLYYVLQSSYSKQQFSNFVVGAATPTFSQEDLANLLIPLPPLAEQKRIADTLDGVLRVIG